MVKVKEGPEVRRIALFDMQVCVPADFTDDEVVEFAESENRCGTKAGWAIRRKGCPALGGDMERVPCNESPGKVHIVLDA